MIDKKYDLQFTECSDASVIYNVKIVCNSQEEAEQRLKRLQEGEDIRKFNPIYTNETIGDLLNSQPLLDEAKITSHKNTNSYINGGLSPYQKAECETMADNPNKVITLKKEFIAKEVLNELQGMEDMHTVEGSEEYASVLFHKRTLVDILSIERDNKSKKIQEGLKSLVSKMTEADANFLYLK